jgi:Tol biopolymer transport system component
VEESQRGNFASVSTNGTIVWASASAADLELAWFGRDGRKLETLPVAPGKVMQPHISPDGTTLAFTRAGRGTADIWLLDFRSGATKQLTTDPGYDESPSWSLDGKALVYGGSVSQGSGLVIATIDGSRPPRVAVSGPFVSEGQFLPKRPSLLCYAPGPRLEARDREPRQRHPHAGPDRRAGIRGRIVAIA